MRVEVIKCWKCNKQIHDSYSGMCLECYLAQLPEEFKDEWPLPDSELDCRDEEEW